MAFLLDPYPQRSRSHPRASRIWQQLAIASNWPVIVSALVLSTLGIVSIWAKSPGDGAKQLLFLMIALGCMAAVQAVNYLVLGRYAWALYFLSLFLIGYTVLGGMGLHLPFVHPIKGASCWIVFPGGFNFEPSELMKLSFLMVLARYLRFRSNYRTLSGLLAPFALALIPVVFILKQPDLGVASLFIPTLLAMLFVAGAKIRHFAFIAAMGVIFIPIFWLSGERSVPFFRHLPKLVHDYQRERVLAMIGTDSRTLRADGFQQERALEAEGSGGLSGKGVWEIPVGRHVPEARNDMIFALIGEQFGWIGSVAVLVAYIVLFAAGVEIAAATREPFGRLCAVGIVCFFAAQSMLNVMVVLRLFPVTGVTLPFVSYGGSSLLASYIGAGFLLNIGQNRPLVIARDAFEFD